MATPSESDIIAVASAYSIPPAILQGLVAQQSANPSFGLPAATIGAYGQSPGSMSSQPLLALELAARTLSQQFSEYGSWEGAISAYLTGDPGAYQSPTSAVGGQVYAILGQAAANPTFGMGSFEPASLTGFSAMATGFGTVLDGMVSMGGVVSPQSQAQWGTAVRNVQNSFSNTVGPPVGSVPYRSNPSRQQEATDILTAAGLPTTEANIAVITTMARGEGMSASTNNPLATTQQEPGSSSINSVGVQAYTSYAEGVSATARTLLNGNYNRMVALMRTGADLTAIAEDPGVQHDLRTWQGGSSEDVNNLRALRNVPGKPQTPNQTNPDPKQVGEFGAQLQAKGIDPQEFAQHFPLLAMQRRKLLQSLRTDVSDYADMHTAAAAAGVGLSAKGVIDYVRGQPHPTYSSLTAGGVEDAFNRASQASVAHLGKMPTYAEAAMQASSNMSWREVNDFYANQADQNQVAPPKNNVVALPQQREQQTA